MTSAARLCACASIALRGGARGARGAAGVTSAARLCACASIALRGGARGARGAAGVTSAARLCACASIALRASGARGAARAMHVRAHVFSCLSLNETRNHAVLGIYAGTSSAQHMARTCVSGTDYKKFRQSNHLAAVATKPVRKQGCGGYSGHSKGGSARVGGRANLPAVRINHK